MISAILLTTGTLTGLVGTSLVHRRWASATVPRALLLLGWLGISYCILAWSLVTSPDVGPAFAALIVMGAGLLLVGRRADTEVILPFPKTRQAPRDTAQATPWAGIVARSLSTLLVAPVLGLAIGLLVWTFMGGHAATRFVLSVFVFLISYALLQIWALGAERAWRALGLMGVLSGLTAALLYVRL